MKQDELQLIVLVTPGNISKTHDYYNLAAWLQQKRQEVKIDQALRLYSLQLRQRVDILA